MEWLMLLLIGYSPANSSRMPANSSKHMLHGKVVKQIGDTISKYVQQNLIPWTMQLDLYNASVRNKNMWCPASSQCWKFAGVNICMLWQSHPAQVFAYTPAMLQVVCPSHAPVMPQPCLKHAPTMPQACPSHITVQHWERKHGSGMPQACPSHTSAMPQVCSSHASGMPQPCLKHAPVISLCSIGEGSMEKA